jgi:hypothetical protein
MSIVLLGAKMTDETMENHVENFLMCPFSVHEKDHVGALECLELWLDSLYFLVSQKSNEAIWSAFDELYEKIKKNIEKNGGETQFFGSLDEKTFTSNFRRTLIVALIHQQTPDFLKSRLPNELQKPIRWTDEYDFESFERALSSVGKEKGLIPVDF